MQPPPVQAASPVSLYLCLWREAASWPPDQRSQAARPDQGFEKSARQALARDDGDQAYEALVSLLSASKPELHRGQILGVMRAVDEAFYAIHPRARNPSPTAGVALTMPRWLVEMRDRRQLTGSYFEENGHRVIARGPLSRRARTAIAASADDLSDMFAAITVAPTSLFQGGRSIEVGIRWIPGVATRGVGPGVRAGDESVSFIPVAEAGDDFTVSETERGSSKVADFQPSSHVDVCARVMKALAAGGRVDIALAPEAVMPHAEADQLSDGLFQAEESCRILVAGTGSSAEAEEGQAWNESRILNSFGVELWRQRKLWPAGWDQDRAASLGLSDPGVGGLVMEDNVAGHRLEIVEIDSLGRCVVLICQDLTAVPLTIEMLRTYQPDWVFVPILDTGVGIGRWSHSQAFALSAVSQSRFLVSSSLSLARKLDVPKPYGFGLALGPMSISKPLDGAKAEDKDRATAFVTTSSDGEVLFGRLTWRAAEGWLQTLLTAH